MKKWNAKKRICLGALILNYLPFLCFALPVYVYTEANARHPVYSYVGDYVNASSTPRQVFFIVSYAAFFLLITAASAFFIRSIRAKSDIGDTEDKFYVFGFTFLILGNAILSMTMFGQGNYIPMAWSLAYVIAGIAMIALHFKKLSAV